MLFANHIKSVITLVSLSLATQAVAQNITGAGASLPTPIYSKWADSYHKQQKVRINYQSIGSSAGVKQITAQTVDFGASDAPLSESALKEAGLIQFPTVIGGVVPVVNIQGIQAGELQLSGDVLAKIFLGHIKYWDDPAIVALNMNLTLPHKKITVVRRADGAGTTFVFTTYLSKVSQDWLSTVGAGTAIKWPIGVGGKGNEGVSAYVLRLPNTIGYVEYAYAKQNKMSYIKLQNADGYFVEPSESAFQSAAKNMDWPASFAQDMTNMKGENVWPLSTTTYILLHRQSQHPEKTAKVLAFFDWAFREGDEAARALDYVPFPDDVKNIIRKRWQQIVNQQGMPIVPQLSQPTAIKTDE